MNRGTMFAIGFLVLLAYLAGALTWQWLQPVVAGIACYFGACAG